MTQIVDTHTVERMARPLFRPRPFVALRGHGNRREAVGYCTVGDQMVTARTPVRPIIERLTRGNPGLRAAALQEAGCVGYDEVGNIFKKAVDWGKDRAKDVVNTADKVAKKVTGKKLVSEAIKIGEKVVKVAKDIAYSPYFQAALVALPVPGTAAIAAGIRAVQTLEALADAAYKGRFDAKAALGLAKASMKLSRADTPDLKEAAEKELRKAKEWAEKNGVKPDAIENAINFAEKSAEKVVKGRAELERLTDAPNAVKKIVTRAKLASGAEKEALLNLAKAVEEKQKRSKGGGRKRGGITGQYRALQKKIDKLTRQAKTEAQKVAEYNKRAAKKAKASGNKYWIPKFTKKQIATAKRAAYFKNQKERAEKRAAELRRKVTEKNRARMKKIREKEAARLRKKAQAEKAAQAARRKAAAQSSPPAQDPAARLKVALEREQKQRKALEKALAKAKKQGGLQRTPELERAAAEQGKRLFLVQAPSRKVYPVAI